VNDQTCSRGVSRAETVKTMSGSDVGEVTIAL
jgi:hypothetical protein